MLFILALIAIIVIIILIIKIRDAIETLPIKIGIVACIIFIVLPLIVYPLRYWLEKRNFQSFSLEELKRHELIIQTIDFKKFIVQGTDPDKAKGIEKALTKYTDELQVYLISGHADICFTDIENLSINEEDSDYKSKTLRLKYKYPDKRNIPFDIDIVVNENDIKHVQTFESKEVNVLGLAKIDLIKPESSTEEKVQTVKAELGKEFERQIIGDGRKLEELDIYQTFLERITEIIAGLSSWENVEIEFVK